ncbi:tyrosine-protein phosphatase [Rhodococcus sp. WB9]|uniref:tyrosine-protein phosphatase n=1 Tax=Rhodococcus sp. WB9 TaxID=2594007 RepID=UPI0021B2F95C|nr:tyrosine-protein phosphatase [Rhodococcus sp. WB9]
MQYRTGRARAVVIAVLGTAVLGAAPPAFAGPASGRSGRELARRARAVTDHLSGRLPVATYGGFDAYVSEGLKLSEGDIAQLKSRLLD